MFLDQRAKLIHTIKNFFRQRNISEVTTDLLLPYVIPEEHIKPFYIPGHGYLQPSPELAMKILLAQGSGDIYQICKAFRQEEQGRLHNQEFTMLEWYRVGWQLNDFIDEVETLILTVLGPKKSPIRISYRDLFLEFLNLDIFSENYSDERLNYLLAFKIEPQLKNNIWIVYDFPASQAALAKLNPDQKTARRFEVFYDGVELANGYDELINLDYLKQRFLKISPETDLTWLDKWQGLPACCGVALGIDRLLMLQTGTSSIRLPDI